MDHDQKKTKRSRSRIKTTSTRKQSTFLFLVRRGPFPIRPSIINSFKNMESLSSTIFKTDEMLNTILGFLPFEEQVCSLRLVNRNFKKTCEALLEEKFVDKIKVIAFDAWESSWFKAEVRRGWSEDSCTNKESCIDDALAMASCRCIAFHNNSKENQENCKKEALRQMTDECGPPSRRIGCCATTH
jgi:hypothetical protein